MITAGAKTLLIGDSKAGKTSIIKKYVFNNFGEKEVPTIGIEFYPKTIEIDGLKMSMNIWDTAGQEKYESVTNNFCRGADGVLIVFDLLDLEFLKNIKKWLDYINKRLENCCKVIVGNKSDLKASDLDINKIQEDVNQIIAPENILFFETSAKTNLNIDQAFEALFLQIANKRKKEILEGKNNDISIKFDSNIHLKPRPRPREEKMGKSCFC